MKYKAVIFDLDGVIVSTDKFHYLAWKKMADEENIYFDEKINERLRGVSRMESLEIVLEKSQKIYSAEDKIELAERKNNYYKEYLKELTSNDILDGVNDFLAFLKREKVKVAIGSSSKNCKFILKKIGLDNYFDVVVDGNDITMSKPSGEVYEKAGKLLGVEPFHCLVVEDAEAGVKAAMAASMDCLAVGSAQFSTGATFGAKCLAEKKIYDFVKEN